MSQVMTEYRAFDIEDITFQDVQGQSMTDLEAFLSDGDVYVNDVYYENYLVTEMPRVGYINVYETTRNYGGPEEGGWWYNASEPVCCSPVLKEHAETELERLSSMYNHDGNIYSVNGTYEHNVCFEFHKGERSPKERPYYC